MDADTAAAYEQFVSESRAQLNSSSQSTPASSHRYNGRWSHHQWCDVVGNGREVIHLWTCAEDCFFKHCIYCCWRYSLPWSVLFTCSVIALAQVVRAILSAVCDFHSLFYVPGCLSKSYLCYIMYYLGYSLLSICLFICWFIYNCFTACFLSHCYWLADWLISGWIDSFTVDSILLFIDWIWRLRGNIIRTAPCWVVWHNVHSQQHTHMSSSLRSSRLGLSHWDPYVMHRGGCLELYYCNMVEWSWWDSSLICKTN